VSAVRAGSITFAVVVVFFAIVVWMLGSRNPYTPAGYVGYLTKGAVFGKARDFTVSSAARPRPGADGSSM
jgi:hypothetical protein